MQGVAEMSSLQVVKTTKHHLYFLKILCASPPPPHGLQATPSFMHQLLVLPSKHLHKTNSITRNAPNQQQASAIEIEHGKWP
jgi:hypothetical protein